MATNISGSITIHRLRNGQTVYISLSSDRALFQSVDSSSGSNACSPDWTDSTKSPTIKPTITALGTALSVVASGNGVGRGRWYYNNTLIYDSGATTPDPQSGSGWKLDTGSGGDFAISSNAADIYAITIKRNIALDSLGAPRVGHDTFRFECDVTIDGITQRLGKDIMATLQRAGDGGFFLQLATFTIPTSGGSANSCGPQLAQNGITELQIVPTLYSSNGTPVAATDYAVEWYATSLSSSPIGTAMIDATSHALFVARDSAANRYQIDGSAVLLCRAYDPTNGDERDVEGITVIDTADAYGIELTGDTTIPDGGTVNITAHLRSTSTGQYVTASSSTLAISWSFTLNEPDGLTQIGGWSRTSTVAEPVIAIADTDLADFQDAVLIAQATI